MIDRPASVRRDGGGDGPSARVVRLGRAGGRGAGFTLFEIIEVRITMAIVAGAVAPSLRGFNLGRQNKYAAAQLVAPARYARSQAISEAKA